MISNIYQIYIKYIGRKVNLNSYRSRGTRNLGQEIHKNTTRNPQERRGLPMSGEAKGHHSFVEVEIYKTNFKKRFLFSASNNINYCSDVMNFDFGDNLNDHPDWLWPLMRVRQRAEKSSCSHGR